MRTNINKHISDLLCEHNCVIIPDFGGFVANYESAFIDSRTNHMFAPKKSIVFNRSLKNNDGLLVNEIAVGEGLTFKQAKKELDKYVLNLNESLSLHKKVFIDEVGTLLLTSDEKVLFVQSNSRNHLLDSYGFTTIQYPAIQRTSVQERFEEKIKHIDKAHLPSNKKPWLKAAAVLIPLLMVSALGISNKDKIHSVYANLSPFGSSSSSTVVEAVETATTHLSSFDVESPTNNIEEAVLSFYEAKNNMTTVVENEVPKHFIVAGAFSSERNANKMISKLQKSNFTSSKIVGKSKSGLYRVSYNGFVNSSDAILALRQIKKTNPSAWLLSTH
ncbi:SPOR domain-containing protein [Flavobacteriales bacterium]|jgi:nucleoid DNA-binding protein|nr:SPOR domain-containing protein [Flavobacteriales bacterium]MDB2361874.1 SPOR domain-containing protein [Flavobacteriales bacterium]